MPTFAQVQSVVESEDFLADITIAETPTPVAIEMLVTPSPVPPASPTPTPTPVPTPTPTPKPTATATPRPTATAKPAAKPTSKPTATPTSKPTAKPTAKPTDEPTLLPVITPIVTLPDNTPTQQPTQQPAETTPPVLTAAPITPRPTEEPTPEPTREPTPKPTEKPTPSPTKKPSVEISGEYSYEDLELAARVAYFETGTNDGYKAVLSVIYHRCMSTKFGGKKTSIPTEVYRSSQFSVVNNSKFETTTAPEKIIEYADDIFNGGKTTVPDTVLFFRAASRGTEWGDKVYYDTIGGNAFFHAG